MVGAEGFAGAFEGADGEGFGGEGVAFVVEQAGEVVEAAEGFGVLGAEGFFATGDGAAKEGFGGVEVALGVEESGKVVDGAEGVGMVGAEDAFAGFEGAAEEGFGGGEVAFGAEEVGEVVEAGEGVGVVGAEGAFAAGEGFAAKGFGGGEVTPGVEEFDEVAEAREGFGVVGTVDLLEAGEGAAVEGFGLGERFAGVEDAGEVVDDGDGLGMGEAAGLFVEGEGLAEDGFGLVEEALFEEGGAELGERLGHQSAAGCGDGVLDADDAAGDSGEFRPLPELVMEAGVKGERLGEFGVGFTAKFFAERGDGGDVGLGFVGAVDEEEEVGEAAVVVGPEKGFVGKGDEAVALNESFDGGLGLAGGESGVGHQGVGIEHCLAMGDGVFGVALHEALGEVGGLGGGLHGGFEFAGGDAGEGEVLQVGNAGIFSGSLLGFRKMGVEKLDDALEDDTVFAGEGQEDPEIAFGAGEGGSGLEPGDNGLGGGTRGERAGGFGRGGVRYGGSAGDKAAADEIQPKFAAKVVVASEGAPGFGHAGDDLPVAELLDEQDFLLDGGGGAEGFGCGVEDEAFGFVFPSEVASPLGVGDGGGFLKAGGEGAFAGEEGGAAFEQAGDFFDRRCFARHVADEVEDEVAAGDFFVECLEAVGGAGGDLIGEDDFEAGGGEFAGEVVAVGFEDGGVVRLGLEEFVGDAGKQDAEGFWRGRSRCDGASRAGCGGGGRGLGGKHGDRKGEWVSRRTRRRQGAGHDDERKAAGSFRGREPCWLFA